MSVVTMRVEKAKTDLFLQKSNDFYIQVRPPPDALRPAPGAAGRAREATTATATTTGTRLRPGGGGHRSLPSRQRSWTGEGNAGDSNLFSNLISLLREFGFIDFSLFLSGVFRPQPATRAISSVRSPRSLPRVRHRDLFAEAVCKGGIPGEIGRTEGVYLPSSNI